MPCNFDELLDYRSESIKICTTSSLSSRVGGWVAQAERPNESSCRQLPFHFHSRSQHCFFKRLYCFAKLLSAWTYHQSIIQHLSTNSICLKTAHPYLRPLIRPQRDPTIPCTIRSRKTSKCPLSGIPFAEHRASMSMTKTRSQRLQVAICRQHCWAGGQSKKEMQLSRSPRISM